MDCLLLFREIFEGRGKQSFFFEVYLYVLFLSLVRKKKVPKRKDSVRLHFRGYSGRLPS